MSVPQARPRSAASPCPTPTALEPRAGQLRRSASRTWGRAHPGHQGRRPVQRAAGMTHRRETRTRNGALGPLRAALAYAASEALRPVDREAAGHDQSTAAQGGAPPLSSPRRMPAGSSGGSDWPLFAVIPAQQARAQPRARRLAARRRPADGPAARPRPVHQGATRASASGWSGRPTSRRPARTRRTRSSRPAATRCTATPPSTTSPTRSRISDRAAAQETRWDSTTALRGDHRGAGRPAVGLRHRVRQPARRGSTPALPAGVAGADLAAYCLMLGGRCADHVAPAAGVAGPRPRTGGG